MKYKPHPYQTQTTNFIHNHPQTLILLDMGLGKTVSTLTAINQLMLDDFTIKKTLIIAPLRVATNTWPEELQKWEHLKHLQYATITGTPAQRIKALNTPAHIYITNRENTPWLVQHLGNNWDFDMLVIDEISSFKTPSTKRFKALKKILPKIRHITGLTGTPTPNSLLDLWAQVHLIDQGKRLGKTITSYRNKYFTPTKYVYGRPVKYELNTGADKHIYNAINDITISMQAKNHLQLPPITYTSHTVKLDQKAQTTYRQLKQDLVADLNGETISALNAASLAGKLLQLANGAIYTPEKNTINVHEAKLDALEDIIEQANGQPLLVAYWFEHDLQRLQKRFPQAHTLTTPEDFQNWNQGKIKIGLIHPAAAGHGLNLQTGGHLICWFALTWSLELYQQLNARLYRQGQTQPVSVIHLVAKNTIDESVLQALKTKNTTQQHLIEAVKTQLNQKHA